MPNYKEMYLHLMRETEACIRILTDAQQTCEELYLQDDSPTLMLLPPPPSDEAETPAE